MRKRLIVSTILAIVTLVSYGEYNKAVTKSKNILTSVGVVLHTSKTINQVDDTLTRLEIKHSIEGETMYVYGGIKTYSYKLIHDMDI